MGVTNQMTEKRVRYKLSMVADEVVEAYTTHGKTLREIADFHNVAPGTVRNLLISRGVSLRSRGRKKNTNDQKESLNGLLG